MYDLMASSQEAGRGIGGSWYSGALPRMPSRSQQGQGSCQQLSAQLEVNLLPSSLTGCWLRASAAHWLSRPPRLLCPWPLREAAHTVAGGFHQSEQARDERRPQGRSPCLWGSYPQEGYPITFYSIISVGSKLLSPACAERQGWHNSMNPRRQRSLGTTVEAVRHTLFHLLWTWCSCHTLTCCYHRAFVLAGPLPGIPSHIACPPPSSLRAHGCHLFSAVLPDYPI